MDSKQRIKFMSNNAVSEDSEKSEDKPTLNQLVPQSETISDTISKMCTKQESIEDCVNTEPLEVCINVEPQKIFAKDEVFVCSVCEYTTNNVDEFENHRQTHVEEKYACNLCTFRTNRALLLMRHIKRHSQVEQYRCDKCTFTCKMDGDMNMLIEAHSKAYSCNKCSFHCCNNTELLQHDKESHSYSCELCDYKTNIINLMRLHDKTHEDKTEKLQQYYKSENCCCLCGFKSNEKDEFYAHIKMHCVKEPASCHLCDYICLRMLDLRKHLSIVHNVKQKTLKNNCPYVCKYCVYECATSAELWQHNRIHNRKAILKCNKCDFTCRTEKKLSKHIHQTHIELCYQRCNICSYQTPLISLMFKHKQEHNRGFYKCDVCTWKCLRLYQLKTHLMLVHKVSIPYEKRFKSANAKYSFVCNLCKFKATTPTSLRNHIYYIHMKPFKCGLCMYRSKTLLTVVQHIKGAHPNGRTIVNQEKKMFRCNLCTYQGGYLQMRHHTLRHTKLHKCNTCNDLFGKDHEAYRQHKMGCHKRSAKNTLLCDLCYYVGENHGDMKSHQQTHRKDNMYHCSYCNYNIQKRQRMVIHVNKKHYEQLQKRKNQLNKKN